MHWYRTEKKGKYRSGKKGEIVVGRKMIEIQGVVNMARSWKKEDTGPYLDGKRNKLKGNFFF